MFTIHDDVLYIIMFHFLFKSEFRSKFTASLLLTLIMIQRQSALEMFNTAISIGFVGIINTS